MYQRCDRMLGLPQNPIWIEAGQYLTFKSVYLSLANVRQLQDRRSKPFFFENLVRTKAAVLRFLGWRLEKKGSR
jgi:hypothetical protein